MSEERTPQISWYRASWLLISPPYTHPLWCVLKGVCSVISTTPDTCECPQTFTHALYHLAANPEYIQSLREEIEEVIRTDGWTKVSMGSMWKLDSFLKESHRVNGISGSEDVLVCVFC